MRLYLLFVVIWCYFNGGAHAQFKTSGIKGYPPQTSGSLISSTGETNYSYSSQYDRNFIPADTYRGDSSEERYYGGRGSPQPLPTRRPLVLDATAQFINQTRSKMATGICYREVPTVSLVHDKSMVPVGNGTTSDMSKIQVCCDGYRRNPHVFTRCDPICRDDCPNGICTAPNTCICVPGHVPDHENRCISTCPLGCGNGICNAQNECVCKPGYTIEPINRKYCVPHCEKPCQYGKCVAPDKCDCYDGYRLTAVQTCEPVCDKCDNGKCTAPGFCTCNAGYLKVDGNCEPVCTRGCGSGRCIAPDTCECPKGFEWDKKTDTCVAHCDQPCLNGVCTAANTCTCNPGYVQDENQRNVCQAHCPQGCPNGFCTAPNFCVCKPGFIKTGIKGRQTCIQA